MTATSFSTVSSQVMNRGLHTLPLKRSSSQYIGVRVDLPAGRNSGGHYSISARKMMYTVFWDRLVPTRWKTSKTQGYKVVSTVWQISVDPGGPVAIILATGSEIRGFKPGLVDGFFQSLKILSMSSFGREVKPWVTCRRVTARKRTSSRN